MGKRMRMTLPKKEEDLQKVVEEVSELHNHHHHHHHHEIEGLDEILHTIDVLMDTMNTRLSDLEEKIGKLREEIINLYKLFGLLVEAMAAEDDSHRKQVLTKAVEILKTSIP
ncbi:hypothetical protein [Hyperthermus butylicus]|uniref:Uncharacterized protein n=1 Tax=Hyperthermus butylicus (strain DSM 5456 / JCM 9403 / PLM1-5) TaxID=415426 RepID=A2BM91_HYPBU|nr:hypothetical protein [Hyperthermus butylicus]ABM81102.1 hypothetical protein Hbut_1270 [Hyperthermus butylicus DSM 5456]